MLRPLSCWICLLFALTACVTPPDRTGEHGGHFVSAAVEVDGVRMPYQVFVPAARWRDGKPLPVILFLHGSGERGLDGIKQTEVGIGPHLSQFVDDFPALVVMPQIPEGAEWSGVYNRLGLMALDASIKRFNADPTRQYLTGLSMGGYGAWNIALDHPHRFAALIPICGAVRPPRRNRPSLQITAVAAAADPYAAIAQALGHIPVWIFHGALDDVVSPEDDRKLYAAFQAAAARDIRYTEYPDANHNAWDATYANPEVWAWLWKQQQ